MRTVIVSPDLEVVIPAAVCQALDFQPGQEVQVVRCENRIELIPVLPMGQAFAIPSEVGTASEQDVEPIRSLPIPEGTILSDALQGRTGLVSFEPSDLSEDTGRKFAELLDRKYREAQQ